MGAAYLFHLVRNHAFVDGNKRVALACALLFFKINRIRYSITEEAAIDLTLAAAAGKMDKGAVTEFFRKHLKPSKHWLR
jgi:death-on-curing protein